jgi:hypothetical protein
MMSLLTQEAKLLGLCWVLTHVLLPFLLPLLLQPELQRVLYPVFVHVYLQLVSYGASQKAAELLQRYRCV